MHAVEEIYELLIKAKKMLLNERNINGLHETVLIYIYIYIFEKIKNFTLHTYAMIRCTIDIRTVYVNVEIDILYNACRIVIQFS